MDEKDGKVKQEPAKHVYVGDGGPRMLGKLSGAWCCRQGGTDPPTPEHLRDGCCQGLQTMDELLEPLVQEKDIKKENCDVGSKMCSPDLQSRPLNMTVKEIQEHLEK